MPISTGESQGTRRERAGTAGPLSGQDALWSGSQLGGAPQLLGHVLTDPSFMPARAASSLAWRSETPMPSFLASKCEFPGCCVPAAMALMVCSTALDRCFSALVMMHLSAF